MPAGGKYPGWGPMGGYTGWGNAGAGPIGGGAPICSGPTPDPTGGVGGGMRMSAQQVSEHEGAHPMGSLHLAGSQYRGWGHGLYAEGGPGCGWPPKGPTTLYGSGLVGSGVVSIERRKRGKD